jgi:hypothetical protein
MKKVINGRCIVHIAILRVKGVKGQNESIFLAVSTVRARILKTTDTSIMLSYCDGGELAVEMAYCP